MALQYAVCALGISAMMTQVTFMRELLAIVKGNEISLGLLLGNWLLFMGVGVLLGKRFHRSFTLQQSGYGWIFLAVIPWIFTAIIRLWRSWIGFQGIEYDIGKTLITSLLLIAPYCLLSGFLFGSATIISAYKQTNSESSRLYSADCIGSVLGGVLFSVLAYFSLDHFSILLWQAGFLISASLLIGITARNKVLTGCSLLLLFFLPFGNPVSSAIDRYTLQRQYPAQNICYYKNSPHGQIVATQSSGQINFYSNGQLMFSTENALEAEESVHYAMSQFPEAKDVLLISGGFSGALKELLKYPIQTLDYVEVDRALVDAGVSLLGSNLFDMRVKVFPEDGRVFLRQSEKHYDAVIINIPSPNTLFINRFFTAEFFQTVKEHITSNGIVSVGFNPFANSISSELRQTYATLAATIRHAFTKLLVIPGGRTYFIASEKELYPDISRRLLLANIPRVYLNESYLEEVMKPDRLALIQDAIIGSSRLNHDFRPALYWQQNIYWLSQFQRISWWIVPVTGLVLLAYTFRQTAVSMSLFLAGFSGSVIQLVLLWAYQICFGSLYLQLGVLNAIFMGGLALGSWYYSRPQIVITRHHLAGINLMILLFTLGLLVGLPWLFQMNQVQLPTNMSRALFILLMGLLSFGVGAEFPMACRIRLLNDGLSLAQLYAADLFGACLGAIATSTVLMPWLGIHGCILFCGLAHFLVALILMRKR